MPSAKSTPPSWFKSFGNAIVRYFARGVLIFAPILITVSILHWMFVSLDGLLQPYVQTPGLGFVIVLVALLVIGWVGSLFVVGRLINLVDSWLERLPGISFIYTSVRDLFKAFVGNKRRFQHTVRARLYASDDVWVIGFLTDEDLQSWELGKGSRRRVCPPSLQCRGPALPHASRSGLPVEKCRSRRGYEVCRHRGRHRNDRRQGISQGLAAWIKCRNHG